MVYNYYLLCVMITNQGINNEQSKKKNLNVFIIIIAKYMNFITGLHYYYYYLFYNLL